jgi:tetratricopeptide (TPR) repeat protein
MLLMNKNIQIFLIVLFQYFVTAGLCQPGQKNYDKGMLAYQKGQYTEAIFQFQKCLDAKPADAATVYNALGNVYTFAQQYEQAISVFNTALDLGYNQPEEILFMLSTIYYNKKDFKKSFDYCIQILDRNKECMDAKVYWRMNLIYSLKSEPENAMVILKKGAKTGVKELQIYCAQRRIAWMDYAEAEFKKVE